MLKIDEKITKDDDFNVKYLDVDRLRKKNNLKKFVRFTILLLIYLYF